MFQLSGYKSLLAIALLASPVAAQASLTGRVVDPNGTGIAGISVRLDGTHFVNTAATGAFTITGLQNNDYDFELRAPTTAWAPVLIENLPVQGATNIGDVVMLPGAGVSGTVTTQSGTPLNGVNMNAYDVNGRKLFTPNDGTNAQGQFSITVPVGPIRLRAVPPVGAPLVPNQQNLNVTANVNVGTIQLEPGFSMTGNVVNSANGLPVGGTKLRAYDGMTGERMEWLDAEANTFGSFSRLMPFGVFELHVEPPVTNPHHARILYGVIVVGPTALGQVRIDTGFALTGIVTGPNGPVLNADIDVITQDGYKLHTPDDNTSATGAFSVIVPPGSYTLRVDPPATSGLVGATQTVSMGGPTNAGTITLAAGTPLTGKVFGPTGPVAFADVDIIDPATGESFVIAGDQTDENGGFLTFAPPGNWGIRVDAPQGNPAAPEMHEYLSIAGPTHINVLLPSKQVVVDATSNAIWSVPVLGSVPMNVSFRNRSGRLQRVRLSFAVRYSSGAETPVLTLPVVPFASNAIFTLPVNVPVPPGIPAGEFGRVVDMVFRARSADTGAVLDEARVEFVVQ